MSRFLPNPEFADNLKGKVVVLTGGASGIGLSTISVLHRQGAIVVFGDVSSGEAIAKNFLGNVDYVKTDVTKYADLLGLFDLALTKYGRVDCAISNAGAMEQGQWVNPELDLESIREMPNQVTLDVNLLGTLYFVRIAPVYLKQGWREGDDKSVILLSSVGGFKETPGMPVYQAAKHGVLGILRCLRLTLPDSHIRINAVCPWFVKTRMTAGIAEVWAKHKLPMNETEGVAKIIVDIGCERGMNGKAIYVEGNRGWEIEENIDRLEPQWLGEEQSKELNRGQTLMGDGAVWQAK